MSQVTPFHRWLISQRKWCERCSDLVPAEYVRNFEGKDIVLCKEHAGRLDMARQSEKRQNEKRLIS